MDTEQYFYSFFLNLENKILKNLLCCLCNKETSPAKHLLTFFFLSVGG